MTEMNGCPSGQAENQFHTGGKLSNADYVGINRRLVDWSTGWYLGADGRQAQQGTIWKSQQDWHWPSRGSTTSSLGAGAMAC